MTKETWLWSRVEVELVCADIPKLLSQCGVEGIPIANIQKKDSLTVSFTMARSDYARLNTMAVRYGASIKILHRKGLFLKILALRKRPVFIFSIGILLFLTLWLPEHILFISVEGNTNVPSGEILCAAKNCGIRFGATRSEVRSEAIKNALLDVMPRLRWAGVNTIGCTAVISVQERAEETEPPLHGAVSSLVAVRDGIVVSGTATAGSLQCTPGQAVRAGETLISAYTDCGISIKAERAKGEIFALTVRPLTVFSPLNFLVKGDIDREIKKFSVIIGKNRINLSKDSGISYTSCDKIRDEYVLTLPGGFALPVTLLVDTYFHWDAQSIRTEGMESSVLSENTAKEYLMESMIAGEILDVVLAEEFGENVYILEGNFLCSEMIARERNEEILEEYGKNRGENR